MKSVHDVVSTGCRLRKYMVTEEVDITKDRIGHLNIVLGGGAMDSGYADLDSV